MAAEIQAAEGVVDYQFSCATPSAALKTSGFLAALHFAQSQAASFWNGHHWG